MWTSGVGDVTGIAATIGNDSDSSMRVRIASPRSLETGIVTLAAGRSMRGYGRGRIGRIVAGDIEEEDKMSCRLITA